MFLTSNDVVLVNSNIADDILFDDVELSDNEMPNPVPFELAPNEKQQDSFIRSCIKSGILKLR